MTTESDIQPSDTDDEVLRPFDTDIDLRDRGDSLQFHIPGPGLGAQYPSGLPIATMIFSLLLLVTGAMGAIHLGDSVWDIGFIGTLAIEFGTLFPGFFLCVYGSSKLVALLDNETRLELDESELTITENRYTRRSSETVDPEEVAGIEATDAGLEIRLPSRTRVVADYCSTDEIAWIADRLGRQIRGEQLEARPDAPEGSDSDAFVPPN